MPANREVYNRTIGRVEKIYNTSDLAGMPPSMQTGHVVIVHVYDVASNPDRLAGNYVAFFVGQDIGVLPFSEGESIIASLKGFRTEQARGLAPMAGFSSVLPAEGNNVRYILVDEIGKGDPDRPFTASLRPLKDPGDFLNRKQIQDLVLEARSATNTGRLPRDMANVLLKDLPEVPNEYTTEKDPLNGSWLGAPMGTLDELLYESDPPPGYIRIGYISLMTENPLEDIQVQRDMPFESVTTLRSRSPILKNNWMSNTRVNLTFTFSNRDSINRVMLPLIRLIRRAPFLPVVNDLLNELSIEGLAFASVQVATIPGQPNSLKLMITAWDFNWHAFFPSAVSFDSLFSYPLLKLWVEKDSGRAGDPIPIHAPFLSPWDGQFNLFHMQEAQLEELTERAKNDPFLRQAVASRSRNATINAFKSAMSIENGLTGPPDPRSLEIEPDFPGYRRYEERRGGKGSWILVDDAGRYVETDYNGSREGLGVPSPAVTIKHVEYSVIVVRDVQIAKRLASMPEVRIYQGDFIINGSPWNQAREGTAARWYTARLDSSTRSISNADFLQGLAHNRVYEDRLAQGVFKFVIPVGSPMTSTTAKTPLVPEEEVEKKYKSPEALLLPDTSQSFNPGDNMMIVEQITASLENQLAPLPARGFESVTFQYMGSTAIYYQVTGKIRQDALRNCAEFISRTHDLARRFPGRVDGTPFGGWLNVENELFKFMATKGVLMQSFAVDTIPGYPGLCQFRLILVEFDPTQRSKEAFQKLTENIESELLNNQKVDNIHNTLDVKVFRWKAFHQRLSRTELYPDLMLPTHYEVQKWVEDINAGKVWDWSRNDGRGAPGKGYEYLDRNRAGTGWQWTHQEKAVIKDGKLLAIPLSQDFRNQKLPVKGDRFADPDFYCSSSQLWGTNLVDQVANSKAISGFILRDRWKCSVPLGEKEYLSDNVLAGKATDTFANTLSVGQTSASQAVAGAGVRPYGRGNRPPVNVTDNVSPYSTPSTTPGAGPIVSPTDQALTAGNGASKSAIERLRNLKDGKWGIIDGLWRAEGISTFAWEHNALRESGGNPDISSSTAHGLYQFDNAGLIKEIMARKPCNYAEAVAIAKDPIEQTKWFIAIRKTTKRYKGQRLSDLGIVASVSDQYQQAVAFTEYMEWPANTVLTQVRGALTKYYGTTPPTQGVTQPQPSNGTKIPPNTPEFRRKVLEVATYLLEQNRLGKAFAAKDVTPRIINFPVSNPAFVNPKAWIDPNWLYNPNMISVGGGTGGAAASVAPTNEYFMVKDQTVSQFAEQWILHNQLPALVDMQGSFGGGTNQTPIFSDDRAIEVYEEITPEQAYYNKDTEEDAFHDLRKELIGGRLLGAFPTFYVAVVDGGRPIRVWRLFDHVYGLSAVTSINVHRDAQAPVETAVVGFSNMYGMLTAQAQEIQRNKELDPRGLWNVATIQTLVNNFIGLDEQTVELWARHVKSTMMKPGARLHIRMGYGSDANELPIVFNGVISEVPVTEGEVQVVALSDGIELMNAVPPNAAMGSIPVYRQSGWWHTGVNPRELIMSFFDPNRNATLQANTSDLLGNISPIFYYDELNRNEFGIEHFGTTIQGRLQRWEGEVGVNVYSPFYSKPKASSMPWENALGILGAPAWLNNEKLIGIQIQNSRVWDIIDTCRRAVPDYIAYAVPVELRSTLFYGKAWFPLYTNYKDEIDNVYASTNTNDHPQQYFHRKTFQQLHIVSSAYNLLQNTVVADGSEVYTKCQAIGTYNGWAPGSRDMGAEQGTMMMVDSDIFTEAQRTMVVETPLYTTQAMKVGDIKLWAGSLLNGAFGLPKHRGVIDHYAAMTLRDSVKKMYKGQLVIFGSGWIKPYDLCLINDRISSLNGPCEVREVVHTMSLQTGFITEITPSAVVSYMDYDWQSYFHWCWAKLVQIAQTMETAGIIFYTNSIMGPFAVRSCIRSVLKTIDAELKTPNEDIDKMYFGKTRQELIEIRKGIARRLAGTPLLKQSFITTRSNNQQELLSLLSEIADANPEWATLFDRLPFFLKERIDIVLFTNKASGKGKDFIEGIKAEASKVAEARQARLVEWLKSKEAAVAKAQDALDAIATKEEQALVRNILTKGDDLASLGESGIALEKAKQIRDALTTLTKVERSAQLATTVGRASASLGGVGARVAAMFKIGLSPLAAAMIILAITYVIEGGIAEAVYRHLHARQCLAIYPLRIGSLEFTAGIQGHRGAVAGDPQGDMDLLLTNLVSWATTPGALGLAPQFWLGFIPFVGSVIDGAAKGVEHYQAPPNPFVD